MNSLDYSLDYLLAKYPKAVVSSSMVPSADLKSISERELSAIIDYLVALHSNMFIGVLRSSFSDAITRSRRSNNLGKSRSINVGSNVECTRIKEP